MDLALCSLSGTEFDPDYTQAAGKKLVVALILPDAAESIKDGPGKEYEAFAYELETFLHFGSLKKVSGSTIKTIGAGVFYGCKALATVNLPAAASIGEWAFLCTGGYIGTENFTITLPKTAPKAAALVDANPLAPYPYAMTVIIRRPVDSTGYNDTWQTGFKTLFGSSNTMITVSFEARCYDFAVVSSSVPGKTFSPISG